MSHLVRAEDVGAIERGEGTGKSEKVWHSKGPAKKDVPPDESIFLTQKLLPDFFCSLSQSLGQRERNSSPSLSIFAHHIRPLSIRSEQKNLLSSDGDSRKLFGISLPSSFATTTIKILLSFLSCFPLSFFPPLPDLFAPNVITIIVTWKSFNNKLRSHLVVLL